MTAALTTDMLLDLYRFMVRARILDEAEENYVKQGKGFFHMPGKGHEASAALNPFLIPDDYLACHYRDKALMLARGAQPADFFRNLFCRDTSDSRGRQMSAFLHNRKLNLISLSGPVANSALHACGAAWQLRDAGPADVRPIVLCGLGDGMTQEGELYEAVLFAAREKLPVLFLIEDNGYAISTKTAGKTFYSTPSGTEETSFCGVPVERINGMNVAEAYEKFGRITEKMRAESCPVIAVFSVDRLSSHTNADDQTVYRSRAELEKAFKENDPITRAEEELKNRGVDTAVFEKIKEEQRKLMADAAAEVWDEEEPQPCFDAKRPYVYAEKAYPGAKRSGILTMNEAINETLYLHLKNDPRVILFGEDIEDPKGDVFGVTRGLSTAFPGRVVNSPLAEATIAGVSAGRALAGGRPVAFIQFADFFPVAMNQLFAEIGNMYWRTAGAWETPVIFMVTCGAYRPGLGPFHASTLESMVLQIPGIDVYMPSCAEDAAGLLHAAFESGRPAVYFYPKNCLNDRGLAADISAVCRTREPGRLRTVKEGTDITLAGWGNTVAINMQAAALLEKNGRSAEVIDLCSLSPWDEKGVLASARKTGKLLVVQEDNRTCGFAGEVAAFIAEASDGAVAVRRLTRPDTYVPFHFGNQLEVLPSVASVTEAAADMLGGSVSWERTDGADPGSADGCTVVNASGSSPSDEMVTVIEWKIKPGDTITAGDMIAQMEADKAAFDFYAPVSGVVQEFFVAEGDFVDVGKPLLSVKTGEGQASAPGPAPSHEQNVEDGKETAVIQWKTSAKDGKREASVPSDEKKNAVGLAAVAYVTGSRKVPNAELETEHPDWAGLEKRTGIAPRFWASEDETAVTLGTEAAHRVLDELGLTTDDLDLVICATGSPVTVSPALACLILSRLPGDKSVRQPGAYDISAACSGYLYALTNAYDFLSNKPDAKILVITSEVLSKQLNPDDMGTAPIFGDAATATLVCTEKSFPLKAVISRPVLSSAAENGEKLCIPRDIRDSITMNGPAVFLAAVKDMGVILARACEEAGVDAHDLDLIVPHQANQRIINAIRQRLKFRPEVMFSNIAQFGNTSSSSIPICLKQILWDEGRKGRMGLCAFGAGFVYAACVIEA